MSQKKVVVHFHPPSRSQYWLVAFSGLPFLQGRQLVVHQHESLEMFNWLAHGKVLPSVIAQKLKERRMKKTTYGTAYLSALVNILEEDSKMVRERSELDASKKSLAKRLDQCSFDVEISSQRDGFPHAIRRFLATLSHPTLSTLFDLRTRQLLALTGTMDSDEQETAFLTYPDLLEPFLRKLATFEDKTKDPDTETHFLLTFAANLVAFIDQLVLIANLYLYLAVPFFSKMSGRKSFESAQKVIDIITEILDAKEPLSAFTGTLQDKLSLQADALYHPFVEDIIAETFFDFFPQLS